MSKHDNFDMNRRRGRGGDSSASSPAEMAELILREPPHGLETQGQPWLRTHPESGQVWRWTGTHWKPVDKDLLWLKREAMKRHAGPTSQDFRYKVVDHIRTAALQDEFAWGRLSDWEVPLLNGVVDLRTMELRPHQPDDMLERVVPHKYCPGATCPIWFRCLDDWFGIESDSVTALQELLGYALLAHARWKKAGLFVGDSNTGKSRVLEVISALVGPENVCNLPLDRMYDPVARSVIVGKAVNIVTELDEHDLRRDGGFKTLVSAEEPVMINPKYGAIYTYLPTAKHFAACNEMPRIDPGANAVWNRFVVMNFHRTFAEAEQDRSLADRLRAEAEGILLWAMDGAQRLLENGGRFTQPAAGAKLVAEYRQDVDEVSRFMESCTLHCEGVAIPLSQLTRLFNRWRDGGRRMTVRQIGYRLRKSGYTIKKVRYEKKMAACVLNFSLDLRDEPAALRISSDALIAPEEEVPGERI